MIFLNIVHTSPSKLHSASLIKDAQQLIQQIISKLNTEGIAVEDCGKSMIAPLFDLYMNHNQEVFNALSKALVLDYCRNFNLLKRDTNQSFRSTLKMHCKVWQESQPGVQELVSVGKNSLLQFNKQANYRAFYTNATEKMPSLQPVLEMVNAYLLADIYAFLPILDEEGSISISSRNWEALEANYHQALEQFNVLAQEAHLITGEKLEEALAI
tara:strand:+ start:920 stop:1558 length:639 start_codon:yes stop_codon:yes gene_type:complete